MITDFKHGAFLFKRYKPRNKLAAIELMKDKDLLSVPQEYLVRIMKVIGHKVTRNDYRFALYSHEINIICKDNEISITNRKGEPKEIFYPDFSTIPDMAQIIKKLLLLYIADKYGI